MKKNYWISVILFFISIHSCYAAILVDVHRKSASILKLLKPPSQLQEMKRDVDSFKITHVRFKQTYAGYLVWGGEIIQHTTQDGVVTFDGVIYQDLNNDLKYTSPEIFQSAEQDKAKNFIMQSYRKKTGFSGKISEVNKKIIIYNDKNSKAHWAYLISFYAKPKDDTIPERPNYIIDAMTFEIYQQWNNIQTSSHPLDITIEAGGGSGGNVSPYVMNNNYIYDGAPGNRPSLSILRDSVSQICYMQNPNVAVFEYTNSAPIQYSCSSTNPQQNNVYWNGKFDSVNGGNSPSNDILYGGGVIINLYQTWFGIPVVKDANNNQMQLIMVAHWPADNAYWDGSQLAMFFGNGVTLFYPLVSLGVLSHEISHGFTQQNAALVYSGQSGGLNESFSDMAAMAAEFFTTNNNTWEIGHEVFQSSNRAIRYLITPSTDCFDGIPRNKCSIDNAIQYFDGLDVHYSSGVFNRFFYLLATTATWDTQKAFTVMVRANRFNWIAATTWNQAACGVITAANTLYGSAAVIDVKNAFTQVGIDTSNC